MHHVHHVGDSAGTETQTCHDGLVVTVADDLAAAQRGPPS